MEDPVSRGGDNVTGMVVLVYRRNYKCVWDGRLKHILLVDKGLLTITEVGA